LSIHEVQAPREEDLHHQTVILTDLTYMDSLSQDYVIKLFESMPQRCQTIVNNGGNWTTY